MVRDPSVLKVSLESNSSDGTGVRVQVLSLCSSGFQSEHSPGDRGLAYTPRAMARGAVLLGLFYCTAIL